jgi:serine/threonine protein kinase
MRTFEEVAKIVMAAKSTSELFGKDPAKTYKKLMLLCHPDKNGNSILAVQVSARLNELYAQLKTTIKIGKWTVQSPIGKGDICDVHKVYESGGEPKLAESYGVLKVARSADDSDLLDREKETIEHLHKEAKTHNYVRYVPSFLDSFSIGDCKANVLSLARECYTLKQLKELVKPSIEPRHLIWMMNRLLSLLGYAHRCGIVHGAITPDHLMYRPSDHGLVVVGWCSSIQDKKKQCVPYISKEWQDLYAPEIFRKCACPGTDIYMAMQSMNWAGMLPSRFDGIRQLCLAGSPQSRPEDAWKVQEQWKALAEEEFGPPSFTPLVLPVN